MKTTRLPIRHGDLALIPIDAIPPGLQAAKVRVLLRGSNNNPHSFDRGTFYPKGDGAFVIGYFVSGETTLTHCDHGEGKGRLKTVKIPDGAWEARRQQEQTHAGMRPVED